ncbi:hypothetical protein PHABIO_293 [Pseudomonas phage Phabio]|uniref:Uncharacterized protein n=1 Tax=Pseudomonas phage Phabio TaxID=2006668 RepID=A0A1Y0SWG3_9CAUD|nr:hypothetical protein MZD05_gp293 [Pseudomonas phage Phabio]ARV76924.1 hypothetical protein PHABIO_293 [Pseudomonas phage Phabio]
MSVYQQLTSDPDRKCRSEVLLRLLLSTSYPQAALTDLTFLLAKHGEIVDENILENLAETMQEVERSFTMFDFVCSIELKRSGKDITIIIKCLDIDPTARSITYTAENIEVMATASLILDSEGKVLLDHEAIARKLLDIFYKSQVSFRNRSQSIQKTRWKHRTKASQQNPSIDTNIDYEAALQCLVKSLKKKNFNIVLTQANILLQDQRARLFSASRR